MTILLESPAQPNTDALYFPVMVESFFMRISADRWRWRALLTSSGALVEFMKFMENHDLDRNSETGTLPERLRATF